jgi:hypothetical protein
MERRFLFFVEREFHAALFRSLAQRIVRLRMGRIGVLSSAYQPARDPGRTIGARPDEVRRCLGVDFELVTDPFAFDPHVVFTADSNYERLEGLGKIVSIGHGTISKGSFYTDDGLMFRENAADMVCTPGVIHAEILSQRLFRPVVVTGIPKLDCLFDGSLDRVALLRGWGLDPNRPTILLAPTFNPEFTLLTHIGFDPRRFISMDYNLVVKLHGATPETWKDALRGRLIGVANTILAEQHDLAPCLFAADVLISDVSSAIYEFLALERPVLLFDSPQRTSHRRFDPNLLENRFRDVGARFADPRRIPGLLEAALAQKSPEPRIAEIARRFVSVRDGRSSEHVLDAALELLENERPDGALIGSRFGDNLKRRVKGRMRVLEIPTGFLPSADELERIDDELVVVLQPGYELSPHAATYLCGCLRLDESVGLAVPLVSERISEGAQGIGRHFPEATRTRDERIAQLIAFHAAGRTVPIESPASYAFACRRVDLMRYLHENPSEDDFISGFAIFLKEQGRSSLVCLSGFLYPEPAW